MKQPLFARIGLLFGFALTTIFVPAIVVAAEPSPSPAAVLTSLGFRVFPHPIEFQEFTVSDLKDTPLNSSTLTGTITLVNLWATWCAPCIEEMPTLDSLNRQMQGSRFRIVAVNVGEKKAIVETFSRMNAVTFPFYLDESGGFGAAFAPKGIPTTYLLDKAGNIIAATVGRRKYDDPALVAILKLLASQ